MTPPTPHGSADSSDELRKLKSRVNDLERELDRTALSSSPTGAILAASAALMLASLAMPWSVERGSAEFHRSAVIGWSIFTYPAFAFVGVAILATAGLAVAAATSRSAGLSLAAHIVATWACGAPLVLLLLYYGASNTNVNRPAAGYYTALIAVGSIAVTTALRRRRLSA